MSDENEQPEAERVYTYDDLANAQRRWAVSEADVKSYEALVYEAEAKLHRALASLAQARADESHALANVKCTRLNWMDSERRAKEQAPAQPVHPDAELRSVTPATEEDRGDQFTQTIATLNAMDHPDRVGSVIDAQTCEEVDPHPEPELPEGWERRRAINNLPDAEEPDALAEFVASQQPLDPQFAQVYEDNLDRLYESDAPEIPEGFTRWVWGTGNPSSENNYELIWRNGERDVQDGKGIRWQLAHDLYCEGLISKEELPSWEEQDIIAYRILEAHAPEQDAVITVADLDNLATKASPEERAEMGEETLVTDLWQQGYDDKLNGYEPSLAEPDYLKGYADCGQILDARKAADEQAKFFAKGMMADADRHAKHDGPFAWLRKREDA